MSGPDSMPNHLIGLSIFSSWANLMLFTVELVLVDRYMRSAQFSKDKIWIRTLVFVLISLDMFAIIISCTSTWKFLIQHAMIPIMRYMWTTPVIVFTTAMVSLLEKTFLIYRVFIMSKGYMMCCFLMLLVFIHIGFTTVSVIYMAVYPHIELGFGHTATTVSFSVEAMVNILIPIAFIWQLRKYKTVFPPSQSLIRRVSIHAFSSGSITAAVGIIFFVLYWVGPLVFIAMSNFHGRIYSITVIANLMARRRNRNMYDRPESTISPNSVINISQLFPTNTHLSTVVSLERPVSFQEHVSSQALGNHSSVQETDTKALDSMDRVPLQ